MTSFGSSHHGKREPLDEPHTHIGAQELLKQKDSVSHSGFLRKRGKLERIVGSNGLFKAIFSELSKWRQRFVIIGRGCLYVFADEQARAPLQSINLRGYGRVERPKQVDFEVDSRRCFQILPAEEGGKTLIFGCAQDGERKIWMQKIREEMVVANKVKDDMEISGTESDEYVYLEKPVIEMIPPRPKPLTNNPNSALGKPVPKPPPDNDDSDDSDYDKIMEVDIRSRRGKPLPALPKEEPVVVKRTGNPQQLVIEIPKSGKKSLSNQEEYLFDGSDRGMAAEILSKRASGTFLVRKSRAGDQQVLSVQTEEGMKEYKIFVKESGLSIDNKTFFNTLDELLNNYRRKSLPNRATTLSRGYSFTQ